MLTYRDWLLLKTIEIPLLLSPTAHRRWIGGKVWLAGRLSPVRMFLILLGCQPVTVEIKPHLELQQLGPWKKAYSIKTYHPEGTGVATNGVRILASSLDSW